MAKMQVDKDLIRELAELINDTDLSEIEVEDGERKIKISRNSSAVHYAAAGTRQYTTQEPVPGILHTL